MHQQTAVLLGKPYAQKPFAYATGPLSVCGLVTLVCYGQMVGWIKMPLCTEVGLGGHIVLDGDPAPPKGA